MKPAGLFVARVRPFCKGFAAGVQMEWRGLIGRGLTGSGAAVVAFGGVAGRAVESFTRRRPDRAECG